MGNDYKENMFLHMLQQVMLISEFRHCLAMGQWVSVESESFVASAAQGKPTQFFVTYLIRESQRSGSFAKISGHFGYQVIFEYQTSILRSFFDPYPLHRFVV